MRRLAVPAAVLLLASCSSPFAGSELGVLPAGGEPGEGEWARAVPLDLSAWKGNVHVRPEVVALDSENSHKSTAACHHGTDNSPPVPVRLLALRSGDELFIRAEWEDPTPDGPDALGRWEKQADGSWSAAPGADDGISIMWGGEEPEEDDRCQRSCHLTDVGLTSSATLMQMKMIAPAGRRYDLWRWRAGCTAPFGAADDMVVEPTGKRGDEGQVIPGENRGDDGAPRTLPAGSAGDPPPYWLVEAPRGREAQVGADGGWKDGHYTVTFRRRLVTGDPDDRAFRAGEEVPFCVAVFDHTFREHHVAAETFRLRLVAPGGTRTSEVQIDPMDF